MKSGKPNIVTLKDSCFWVSQSWTCYVSDIRPSVISSTVCACIRVGFHAVPCFTGKAETAGNANASSLHLQHRRSHRSQGQNSTASFCTETLDLGIYENDRLPGLNQHFDEVAWGWPYCVAVVRGLSDTPCLSAVILPHCEAFSYAFFSWVVFFSPWTYINVSPVCPESSNKAQL